MKNPPWTRDEHIIALDFYLSHLPSIPGKYSSVIQQNIKIFSFFYVLIAIGFVLLLTTPKVHANESHCYSIQNSDAKNSCLAMAKHQESYCYSIHESDAKNLCLAQIKNQKSYCYSIKSSDTKNQCLALVN